MNWPTRMQWAVVQFEDEMNSISTVPHSWVVQNDNIVSCHWPDAKVRKHIASCSAPNENWKLYRLLAILKEFNKYEEALEFEKTKEVSSNSDTETNRFGRKQRKKHLHEEFSYSGGGGLIDSPPKLNDIEIISECDTDSFDEDMALMPPPISVNIPKKPTPTTNETSIEDKDTDEIMADAYLKKLPNDVNNMRSEGCCEHAGMLNAIFENIISIKTILREQQKAIEDIIICQSNKENNQLNTSNNFESIPRKPFKNIEKLLEFDEKLKNFEEGKKQLEIMFYMCGGRDSRESIRRGMAKIFSDNLARKCSLTGRKGNHPLKNLTILSVLKDATMKRFHYASSDKEFESNVAAWLRQSQLRYERHKLRKKGEASST